MSDPATVKNQKLGVQRRNATRLLRRLENRQKQLRRRSARRRRCLEALKLEEEQERSGEAVGLDLSSGETFLPASMGVWDSFTVKKQTLNLSTILATQLLLVDEVMKAGKAMGKQPAQGGEDE